MEKIAEANDDIKIATDTYERDYKAEIGKLNSEEKKLAARFKKLDEMKLEVTKACGDFDVTNDDLVEINAGGKAIAVTRSVLTQFTGTRLEALFSGRWDRRLQRDSAGQIFLDVNPICFQAIVDYLNEVKISTKDNPAALPTVDAEYQNILTHLLDFFGLLYRLGIYDSKIIQKADHAKLLNDWLSEDELNGNLTLLYRSSRDGRCDSTFHQKCDLKGATLTVIETTEGYIMGGYSNLHWANGAEYGTTDKAFLFNISKLDDGASSKMKVSQAHAQSAIYNNSLYGPTFGCGHDFKVQGAYLYLSLGNSYQLASNIVRRHGTFTIKEMEVFQVTSHLEIDECSTPKHKRPKIKHTHTQNNRDTRASEKALPNVGKEQRFSQAIHTAFSKKWAMIKQVNSEITALEASFIDEKKFMTFISSGKDQDIISLNVCGTIMTTTHQTLQHFKTSVLASKVSNVNQNLRRTNQKPIAEWNTEDVVAWLKKIDGLPCATIDNFQKDEVTGRELIALGKEGLMDFGIKKRGTIFYILAEIKKLVRTQEQSDVLIEHSPYCFEKIIDHLRLESMFARGLVNRKPEVPTVRASEKNRFEKVVKHYFPGDDSKVFLENSVSLED
ncbi:hypothetical protein HJC23_001260 [Cyclotella cryptica]|uniref:SAM domain-containing protein n=1 Tax=Cyclotella cryptica TaxID=29204 RepID=A0ABD3PEK8_9STRA|eukprot:CCRYP_015414-RA/>CCRYP_015414-RA protein AED:0.01 eAED:-0.01 QI:0/-1/0/1/-1/1/1/0/612